MDIEGWDASTFNNLFITSLDTREGMEKAAVAGGAFVRERLREVSFARPILPPEPVTKADCQVSPHHDYLVKIVGIEPGSKAAVLNFRGRAVEHYIEGKRYEIPFFKIASDKYVAEEGELLANDFPVTQVIEENSVKDIQATYDGKFIEFSDAIVFENGKDITPAEPGPFSPKNAAKLFKALDTDELAVGTILMHKADWDDFMALDAHKLGDALVSEVVVNGYKYNTILGHKLVVTIKPIVRPGVVRVYTDPKYLGNAYTLGDTRFYIEKRGSLVSWECWEYDAIGFGNVRAVARMTLN
jgi:hypothetical protein